MVVRGRATGPLWFVDFCRFRIEHDLITQGSIRMMGILKTGIINPRTCLLIAAGFAFERYAGLTLRNSGKLYPVNLVYVAGGYCPTAEVINETDSPFHVCRQMRELRLSRSLTHGPTASRPSSSSSSACPMPRGSHRAYAAAVRTRPSSSTPMAASSPLRIVSPYYCPSTGSCRDG